VIILRKKLIELRESKNLSQNKLAIKAELCRSAIVKYENDSKVTPNLRSAINIARILDIKDIDTLEKIFLADDVNEVRVLGSSK
jgi:DNA-binding XRE family transcriptional regulator